MYRDLPPLLSPLPGQPADKNFKRPRAQPKQAWAGDSESSTK